MTIIVLTNIIQSTHQGMIRSNTIIERSCRYKKVMKQRKNIKNVSFYHFMCIIHSNCSIHKKNTQNHIFIAECLSVFIRSISLDYRSITFILPIPFFLTFYIKTFRKNAFLLKYSRINIM